MKILLFLILFIANSAFASHIADADLVADLDTNIIEINSSFSGQKITLFGAKLKEGDIYIVLRGPKKDYAIRKKEKKAGVWMNGEQVMLYDTDSFYHFTHSQGRMSAENQYILEQLRLKPSIYGFERNVEKQRKFFEFEREFIDHMEKDKLYSPINTTIDNTNDTLFRVELDFPENITVGNYLVEVYLINNGNLIASDATPIKVKKVGFENYIYIQANTNPFRYGLAAVLIALFLGFSVSIIANRFF